LTKSNTLTFEPKRAAPYADIALPIREKLRKDKELPRLKKSTTAIAEPKRAMPTIDTALLTRAKFRSAMELESVTKSSTLHALPIRPKLRRLKHDPRPRQSSTASWLLKRPTPTIETELPKRLSCRTLRPLPR
jgi:hypothetical protein